MTFDGYPRPSGRAGTRNHVAILSVMESCNTVVRGICSAVQGTVPITMPYMRGQLGQDLETTMATLAGMASNPNVFGTLVVGLEPVTSEALAALIEPSGKPVEVITIQGEGGTIDATAKGTRRAASLFRRASAERRQPCPVSDLIVGLECGGSDTTSGLASNPAMGHAADRIVGEGGCVVISETSEFLGAEQIFAKRAVSAEVGEAFLSAVLDHERAIMAEGVDLRGSNPTRDNIRGGLTTIEEKSLGAMAKAGSTPLVGVLGYGEAPQKGGLHFMATPAPAVESLTGLSAGGVQVNFFSTGVGNPIGSMISTTIKITGNRNTAEGFADHIDCDVSDILETGESIGDAGDRLFDYLLRVAGGDLTASEILNVRDTAVSRFGLSM